MYFQISNWNPNLGLLFKRRENFRLLSFCDVDYVDDKVERNSTSGSYHFIGGNFITWTCKKQVLTTLSTAEAEYMSATSSYAQLLWIKNQLEDYNIYESKIPIYYDNTAGISLSQNPTLYSKARHVEIKHYFIRDHVRTGTMDLQFVPTDDQLADIFTTPLIDEWLILLRNHLGMVSINE